MTFPIRSKLFYSDDRTCSIKTNNIRLLTDNAEKFRYIHHYKEKNPGSMVNFILHLGAVWPLLLRILFSFSDHHFTTPTLLHVSTRGITRKSKWSKWSFRIRYRFIWFLLWFCLWKEKWHKRRKWINKLRMGHDKNPVWSHHWNYNWYHMDIQYSLVKKKNIVISIVIPFFRLKEVISAVVTNQ